LTRLDKLKKIAFETEKFDAFLILNDSNLLYFLGFPGASGLLIPADDVATIYVHGVNFEQIRVSAKSLNVELVKKETNLLAEITSKVERLSIAKLAVDAISANMWFELKKYLPRKISLELNNTIVESLRVVKEPEEIDLIRKASELTNMGMEAALQAIKPGAKEFEVAAEIEYAMRKRGSGPTAFETIVASGTCSAFPHGDCSRREIRQGDFVMVDIGATYKHYCADMTRTFVAGKPTEKQNGIYDLVRRAQNNAINKIKDGMIICEIDSAARKTIETAGYGEYFVHRLGHGVGLEIHEPPSVGPDNQGILTAGNVFTVEPGIYLPGYGGVRIEDTVLVTAGGAERLTFGCDFLNVE
jgi:Xaa-Pro dipeptidase